MLSETINFTTEDIDCLPHGDRPLKMRLFRPATADVRGLCPAVLDLHGGAWTKGTMESCSPRDAVLAGAGILAAALDFRHAGDGYPTSLVDINYAVRWLKAQAGGLGIDPARIGICGQSSGGHLAMLAAMRPFDPRYGALALEAGAPPVDATVACVGMAWPVINPLSRYRHALRCRHSESAAGWVKDIPERHDLYWKTEDAMAEGSSVLALETKEAVQTPPALWVQGRPDPVHDYRDPDSPVDLNEPERFARAYREAGGEIEVFYIDQATRASNTSFDPLAAFFRKHLA